MDTDTEVEEAAEEAAGLERDPEFKSHLTIKKFKLLTRRLALRCARRQGLSMAEWMDRAVHTQARLEGAQDPVQPPGAEEPYKIPPTSEGFTFTAAHELQHLKESWDHMRHMLLLAQTAKMITEASGRPMNKTSAGRVLYVIDQYAKQAQTSLGYEPRKRSAKASKKTSLIDGFASGERSSVA